LEETELDDSHNQLLNAIRKLPSITALPQIHIIENKKYLVLVAPFAWLKHKEDIILTATEKRNVIFLDLEDEENYFTIFDAELFLGTRVEEKYS